MRICALLLSTLALHATAAVLCAQRVQIRTVPQLEIPTRIDGNSPTFWRDGQFQLLTSIGTPVILTGSDQFSLGGQRTIQLDRAEHMPLWIESAWADADGTVYGWYHHEPAGLCGGNGLTAPQIGAAISADGGQTFLDLGIVLSSGDPIDCSAKNGFFGGGNGDFSVILDRSQSYFYFLFTNYGGALDGQGVAIARLAFDARRDPTGNVHKFFNGDWHEPGLGGRVTPVFPTRVSWQRSDTDSFWGPAIHWNSYLESYVVLLNRACCSPRWPQEGIYASFNADLSDPGKWTQPQLFLKDNSFAPGYYPEVIGLGTGETDSSLGEVGRLYVQGKSKWEITFVKAVSPDQPSDPEPPGGDGIVVLRR